MKFLREDDAANNLKNIEINITSLVDIVFLLLIFFMLTTQFSTQQKITVSLPKAQATKPLKESNEIRIKVLESGEVFLGDQKLALSALQQALETKKLKKSVPIYVAADQKASYQRVVSVLDTLNLGGYQNIALLTKSASAK